MFALFAAVVLSFVWPQQAGSVSASSPVQEQVTTASEPDGYVMVVVKFSYGFIKGSFKGIYYSIKWVVFFLVNCIIHPINTFHYIYDLLAALVHLGKNDQWGTIIYVIVPDLYQLVNQWDGLRAVQVGEKVGALLAKHGIDILAPDAFEKIAQQQDSTHGIESNPYRLR